MTEHKPAYEVGSGGAVCACGDPSCVKASIAPVAGDETRRVHDLKTWPQYFGAVLDGSKAFEARFDDREFEVGDTLRLREWNPETGEYTGREVSRIVSYKLNAGEFVREGYCILSLAALRPAPETAASVAWGVTQTITGDDGNCLEACLATIFALPLDAVPRFRDETWWEQLLAFLAERGLTCRSTMEPPSGLSVAVGESPRRSVKHAVVAINGFLAFDPHPDRTFFRPASDVSFLEISPIPVAASQTFICGGDGTPLKPAAQAELNTFETHLREHRRTEPAVEGCRFCIERDAKRLLDAAPASGEQRADVTDEDIAHYKKGCAYDPDIGCEHCERILAALTALRARQGEKP